MSRNIAASIRQKLLNFTTKTGDDPNLIWSRYAVERLLYRLSVSEFLGEFVLKGAALFIIWSKEIYRPTMDLDLLGYGEPSSARMENVFRRLCKIDVVNDGLEFDEKSVRVVEIREEAEYHGRRIKLVACLGNARIPIQVDIGFGDAITPKAELVSYPSLLDLPAPRIWAYPRPTVIAEKLYAMVALGIANSRMKDFYEFSPIS